MRPPAWVELRADSAGAIPSFLCVDAGEELASAGVLDQDARSELTECMEKSTCFQGKLPTNSITR